MKIKKVEAYNFLSYQKLILNIDDYADRFVLVEGKVLDKPKTDSNGAGKSTIAEALVYGLFGKTMRGIKYADDIVNSQIKKDCCVKIFLGDYVIERYRKHGKHKNMLFFFKKENDNVMDLRGKSDSDTQIKINDIIGMDYGCFVGSHVFTGSSARFTSMSDNERKEILRKLSSAEWINQSLDNVKKSQKINSDSIYQNNIEISKAEGLLEGATNVCDGLRVRLKNLSTELESFNDVYETRVADTEQHVKKTNTMLLEAEKALKHNIKCVSDYEKVISKNEGRILKYQAIEEQISIRSDDIDRHNKEICNIKQIIINTGEAINQATTNLKLLDKKEIEVQGLIDSMVSPDDNKLLELEQERALLADSASQNVFKDLSKELLNVNTEIGIANNELKKIDLELANVGKSSICNSCGQEITQAYLDGLSSTLEKSKLDVNHILEKHLSEKERIEQDIATVDEIHTKIKNIDNEILEFGKKKDSYEIEKLKAQHKIDGLKQARESDKKTIESKKLELDGHTMGIKKLEELITNSNEYIINKNKEKALIGDVDSVMVESNKLKHEIKKINQNEIPEFNHKIKKLNDILLDCKGKMIELTSEKDKLDSNMVDVRTDVKKAEKEKDVASKAIVSLIDKKNILDEESLKLKIASKIFGKDGIQNYVFNLLIPQFKNKVNYYVSQLSDDIAVDISTKLEQKSNTVNKINFNPYVIRGGGSGYSSISSGQKRRVDIATSMAIKSLYSIFEKGFGLTFYDEILDNLDAVGVGRVVDMLKRDNGTRFLITHNNDIKSEFDDVLTIHMKKNISNLVT